MSKPGVIGRGDLLRIVEALHPLSDDQLVRTAALARYGYRSEQMEDYRQKQPEAPKPFVDPDQEQDVTVQVIGSNRPAPIPFYFPERFKAQPGYQKPPARSQSTYLGWTSRPADTPEWKPIAPWRDLAPKLKPLLASTRRAPTIDVKRAIDTAARGKPIDPIPYRAGRAWSSTVTIILDRSDHLAPLWADQDMVAHAIAAYMGITTPSILLLDPDTGQMSPFGSVAETAAPHTNGPVLVISDLGTLRGTRSSHHRFWRRFARSLGEGRAKALSPAPLSFFQADLLRDWDVVEWESQRRSGALSLQQAEAQARTLMTLVSRANRLEPGLVRQIRRSLLPDAGADVEAILWRSPALRVRHSQAAALNPEQANALRRSFRQLPLDHRETVLAHMRAWRALVHEAVWFEEILDLDEASRTVVPASDIRDAKLFFASVHQSNAEAGGRSSDIGVRAWLSRMGDRVVTALQNDDLREAVWSEKKHDPDFAVTPGSVPPPKTETFDIVALHHADGLTVVPQDSLKQAKGSSLAVLVSRDGLVEIEPVGVDWDEIWDDLGTPDWVADFGEDQYGPWADFEIDGVTQRLRWCPPGSFLMGSPKDEAERFDDEGPQTEITFAAGFWLFDTAVSQRLWSVVMGENPSQFRGDDLPVESVRWDDVRSFLSRINERIPGLGLRLPSEAEWEYACRAGSSTPFEPSVASREEGMAITSEDVNFDGKQPMKGYPGSEFRGQTVPVKGAAFVPNAWGLWHMHGNVWERCEDEWSENHVGADELGRPRMPGPGEGGDDTDRSGCPRRLVGQQCQETAGLPVATRLPSGRFRDYGLGFRPARGQVSMSSSQAGGARRVASGPEGRTQRARPATGREKPVQRFRVPKGASNTIAMPNAPFVIRTDLAEVTFARKTRDAGDFDWADGIGRDAYGLWAEFTLDKVTQRLRFCPPGQFMMGSPDTEGGRYEDEGPQQDITFHEGFWLFETPVTVRQWRHFVNHANYKVEKGAYTWTGF